MNKYQVRYKFDGHYELSAPYSLAFCELMKTRYSHCGEFSEVEVVEAQQPALPDIADDRWDVRADGDGGWA